MLGAALSRFYVQATILALGCVLALLRYSSTLPTVMQDEYVYLVQAALEPRSANEYGNFLYSAVYSNVTFFDASFYFGAKALNTVFLFAFAMAVLVVARKYLPSWAAAACGITTVLSATTLYASVFMPEMMFFALSAWAVTLFVVAWEAQRASRYLFFASLVMLVLAGLTKPHAIFLLTGIMAFTALMLVVKRVTYRRGMALLLCFPVGYSLLKMFIGYSLAGPAGLSLIGPAYEKSLVSFLNGLNSFSQGALSASAGAMNPVETKGVTAFALFVFVQIFLLAIGFSFMTLGLPFLLVRPISKLDDYQLLISSISVVYIIAIAGFTAFVSFTGDDHSSRLLGRYFEFLVPLVLVACFMEIRKRNEVVGLRAIALFASIPILGIGTWLLFSKADLKLADSAILLGALREAIVPWLVVISWTIVVFAVSKRPKHLLAATVTGSLLLVSLTWLSAQQRQIDSNSVKVAADFAGDQLRDGFSEVPGEQVVVVGTNKQLAFVTKFWSLKKGVQHIILSPGTGLSAQDPALTEFSLFVELPGVGVTDGVLLLEGEGYRIFGK